MLRIKVSDDASLVQKIREGLSKNDGYCPCKLQKTWKTKCMCLEFLEQLSPGPCHCGLYEKIEIPDDVK